MEKIIIIKSIVNLVFVLIYLSSNRIANGAYEAGKLKKIHTDILYKYFADIYTTVFVFRSKLFIETRDQRSRSCGPIWDFSDQHAGPVRRRVIVRRHKCENRYTRSRSADRLETHGHRSSSVSRCRSRVESFTVFDKQILS